jgi:hypothetical protein
MKIVAELRSWGGEGRQVSASLDQAYPDCNLNPEGWQHIFFLDKTSWNL